MSVFQSLRSSNNLWISVLIQKYKEGGFPEIRS